ncbi:MAG TPA: HAD family phosphatase [Acidobacteriaceae bacterium]|nr:HAD family phosphatase [Acidobacteriaceae bacterium]
MPIRGVIFDYGLVLSRRDPIAHEKLVKITGLDLDTFERIYWPGRPSYDLAQVDGPGYWKWFASEAGISFTQQQIEALVHNDVLMWAALNPSMVAWAGALEHAGIRTAVLSNMIPDLLRYMRNSRDFAWLSGFSQLTWSCELGMAKPDPEIYTYTCDKLGVAAAETLFLDDNPKNVRAAEALGIQGITFTNTEQLREDLARRGFLQNVPQPGDAELEQVR